METHLIEVQLDEEEGALAAVARVLASASLNISGFCVDRQCARFLSDRPRQAEEALSLAGFRPSTTRVAELRLDDRPGELARFCEALAARGVRIEHGFGLAAGGLGRIYIRVDDLRRAAPVFDARGKGPLVAHAGLGRI